MKRICGASLFLLVLMGLSLSARALPPQAEADMLMQEIGTSMKGGNYAGLPEKFQRVAALKASVPDSFEYHWGKTAFETRDYAGAMSHLDRYISSAGRNGKYYEDALAIYSRATSMEVLARRKIPLNTLLTQLPSSAVLVVKRDISMSRNGVGTYFFKNIISRNRQYNTERRFSLVCGKNMSFSANPSDQSARPSKIRILKVTNDGVYLPMHVVATDADYTASPDLDFKIVIDGYDGCKFTIMPWDLPTPRTVEEAMPYLSPYFELENDVN